MSVNITWSSTNGGTGLTSISHGSGADNTILANQTIYIRHDGVNSITNCKLYISSKESYTGDFSAAEDLNKIQSWGDMATVSDFGGLQINQDAINSFAASWPTYSSKGSTSSLATAFRTGVGDFNTGIDIHTNTGATSTGVIQTGTAPNVRFKLRIAIPDNVTQLGTREFTTKLRYTYTS